MLYQYFKLWSAPLSTNSRTTSVTTLQIYFSKSNVATIFQIVTSSIIIQQFDDFSEYITTSVYFYD